MKVPHRVVPIAFALAFLVGPALADNAANVQGLLPKAVRGPAVATDGQVAWIIGGIRSEQTEFSPYIARYDPVTDEVDLMNAHVIPLRTRAAAVYVQGMVYVFGGGNLNGGMADIARYDPATDTFTTLATTLPTPRSLLAVASVDGRVYVMGGIDASGYLDDILRFDPATGTLTKMNAHLPTARMWGGAFSDGRYVYYLGGGDSQGDLSEVVRYDPVADRVAIIGDLSFRDAEFGVASDGRYAYKIGGGTCGYCNTVVRFDTVTRESVTMAARLPTGRSETAAAFIGNVAYAFGGGTPAGSTKTIVRYSLVPPAPSAVAAGGGPGVGEIQVSWTPPPSNTYSGAITYRVLAGDASGAETFVGETASASWIESGLPEAARRYYVVQAQSGGGVSPSSAEVTATAPTRPGAPQGLAAGTEPEDLGGVRLTWSPPANDGGLPVTQYWLYRTSDLFGGTERVLAGSTSPFVDRPSLPGPYEYRVSAENGVGEGPQSEPVQAIALTVATP